jgi:hypothetical protein
MEIVSVVHGVVLPGTKETAAGALAAKQRFCFYTLRLRISALSSMHTISISVAFRTAYHLLSAGGFLTSPDKEAVKIRGGWQAHKPWTGPRDNG